MLFGLKKRKTPRDVYYEDAGPFEHDPPGHTCGLPCCDHQTRVRLKMRQPKGCISIIPTRQIYKNDNFVFRRSGLLQGRPTFSTGFHSLQVNRPRTRPTVPDFYDDHTLAFRDHDELQERVNREFFNYQRSITLPDYKKQQVTPSYRKVVFVDEVGGSGEDDLDNNTVDSFLSDGLETSGLLAYVSQTSDNSGDPRIVLEPYHGKNSPVYFSKEPQTPLTTTIREIPHSVSLGSPQLQFEPKEPTAPYLPESMPLSNTMQRYNIPTSFPRANKERYVSFNNLIRTDQTNYLTRMSQEKMVTNRTGNQQSSMLQAHTTSPDNSMLTLNTQDPSLWQHSNQNPRRLPTATDTMSTREKPRMPRQGIIPANPYGTVNNRSVSDARTGQSHVSSSNSTHAYENECYIPCDECSDDNSHRYFTIGENDPELNSDVGMHFSDSNYYSNADEFYFDGRYWSPFSDRKNDSSQSPRPMNTGNSVSRGKYHPGSEQSRYIRNEDGSTSDRRNSFKDSPITLVL